MKSWYPWVCCSAILSLAGCGSGTPQFSYRDDYQQLEPFAQEYVAQSLETYFGTPTESVAWERLPVTYHYGEGTVAAGASDRKVQLELASVHSSLGPGVELHFGSSGESGWIAQWDAETRTATLESALKSAPATGEAVLVGPGAVLKEGRHLYAQHCQHCHGVSGDGNGPTAPYLNPRPRDYRNGKFKFTTTAYEFGPNRGDLDRIIRDGIPGTYMPSFKLLKDAEMEAIREYVMWLSMRGEIEMKLIAEGLGDYKREAVQQRVSGGDKYSDVKAEFEKRVTEGEIDEAFNSVVDLVIERWTASNLEENLVKVTVKRPEATPESIARGRALYLHPDNKCATCHGEAGYGDGPQTYTLTPGKPGLGLYDDWNNPVVPRNLHTGIFRGGRRPYDLFCRVRASVKGTPMPKFDAMKEEDVWDLVNYIYSIPYEEEQAGTGRVEQAAGEAHPAPAEPEKKVAGN